MPNYIMQQSVRIQYYSDTSTSVISANSYNSILQLKIPIYISVKVRLLNMSFYRSETVKHYKLVLPRDNAEQIMHSLGQHNLIHVVGVDAPLLDRPFIHQVKRCNQCLMKLREIQNELSAKSILVRREEFTNKQYEAFIEQQNMYSQDHKINSINVLDRVDRQVEQMWSSFKQSAKRIQLLKQNNEFMRQNLAILIAGSKQFGSSFFSESARRFEQFDFQFKDMASSPQLSIKVGVLKIDDQFRFKRTVFRISRGNCFVIYAPYSNIFPNLKQNEHDKLVFFILFSGLKNGNLDKKLDRFITSFCPKNYYLPQNLNDFNKQKISLQHQLQQNENVLVLNQTELREYLTKISQFLPHHSFSKLQSYKIFLMKQKQIYNILNEMQVFNNFLQADIYVRRKDIMALHSCLKDIEARTNYPMGQLIEAQQENLPTYFIRNRFTCSAQEIVETYGVARYKEANPSYFTALTFPFLFGVMFGDIAHGALLMTFGLLLVFKRQLFQHAFFKMLMPHRYIIVLMGFFSMYCGLIYNQFMSISLNLFGSCYNVSQALPNQIISRKSSQCVYPIGLDPVWAVATNNLNYVDSLKMKISVIIAVVHMTLGIFIKGSNSLYFKKKLDLFFQFIPQLLFMVVLFGYMDFLIIYKWLKPWTPYDPAAPSIITTMINLPLKLGQTEDCCGGQPMWGSPGNTSQNSIQVLLLVIACICVPLMLLPKPLIQIYFKQKISKDIKEVEGKFSMQFSELVEQKHILKQENHQLQKNQQTSQIFVHQLIQTIEFVLGSISNTASYLRLWALSLAHSQLSQVFLQKTVQSGIAKGFSGIPIMIFGFPVLASATLGVLLCMDSMECFLHTLRLHWVEFQNKFYKGDGYAFTVFNFKNKISQQLKSE